jgi:broad specificity phosphatase PhoE
MAPHGLILVEAHNDAGPRSGDHTIDDGRLGMTTLVMVRHGHTALNRDVHHDQFRGQTEIPLDERGLHEAEITAGVVAARWQPAALYSSPVLRAVKQLATKHDGQTIVLVTHTLVIRLVLLGAMGLPTNGHLCVSCLAALVHDHWCPAFAKPMHRLGHYEGRLAP